VRPDVRSALDIGTGSGIQALLAARHSSRVTATDINPRAIAFARFNALLNDMSAIECLQGSLTEPVEDERFDLIVCNPPYVVSPERTHLFRDGTGGLCELAVRAAGQHLEEAGYACVVAQWGVGKDADWAEPARQWIRDLGCDCLLLGIREEDALSYAGDENRHLAANERQYADALDSWEAHYETSGISRVVSGVIILRRRSGGDNWVHAEQAPRYDGDLGSQLMRMFQGRTLLHHADANELAARRPRLVAPFDITNRFSAGNGGVQGGGQSLQLTTGLRFAFRVSDAEREVISRIDGETTVRKLGEGVPGIGAGSDSPANQVVRTLLRYGVVEVS
jgi:methylase of polypeptide subunit release factors